MKASRILNSSDVFFNVVRTLKEDGWTADGIAALLERYPRGIARKYRGRLRREVDRVYGKIKIKPRLPVPSSTGGSGAPPPQQPPPAPGAGSSPATGPSPTTTTIEAVHDVFKRWLGKDYDTDVLNAVLATAAAERLTGDPLWLLVVSGPGNAKTETVQALSGAGALVTTRSRRRVRCCRRRHGRPGAGRQVLRT